MTNLIPTSIDFTVLNGTGYVSQTKLAEMCGVTKQAIQVAIQRKASYVVDANLSENNQLDAKSAYNVVVYHATQGKPEAIKTLALIGEAGLTAYIYHQAGYTVSASKPDVQMPQADVAFQRAALLTQMCINNLNLPQSGQLKLMADLGKQFGVPTQFLPSYGVDAPPQAVITSGSSVPTMSLTAILKPYTLSAKAANQILIAHGLVEERTRHSTTKGTKTFKALTDKGLKYGKNITSPSNPREVQIHWYADKADELLKVLGLK